MKYIIIGLILSPIFLILFKRFGFINVVLFEILFISILVIIHKRENKVIEKL